MSDDIQQRAPLPSIPDPDDPNFAHSVKNFLEQIAGTGLDGLPSRRELFEAGVVDAQINGVRYEAYQAPPPGAPLLSGLRDAAADPPTTPSNVIANAASVNIILQWDQATFRGLAFSEIWRASSNNRANAIRIGTTTASVYADAVGEQSASYYYWVRHVNTNNVAGAFHAGPTSGLLATTTPITAEGADPLSPSALWRFTTSVLGWTANNASITPQGTHLQVFAFQPIPQLDSPTIAISGSLYNLVQITFRRTLGSTWTGRVYYSTSGHGFDPGYYATFPEPSGSSSYVTATIDMYNLAAGGDDWKNNTITGLRIELGATLGDNFDVEYIATGVQHKAITALDGAVIVDLTVVNAKIANATIEGGKIAVSTIQADRYLELRNSQLVNFMNELDSAHPLVVDFPILTEAFRAVALRLSFRIRPFRATTKSGVIAAGGEVYTSAPNVSYVPIANHDHEIAYNTAADPNSYTHGLWYSAGQFSKKGLNISQNNVSLIALPDSPPVHPSYTHLYVISNWIADAIESNVRFDGTNFFTGGGGTVKFPIFNGAEWESNHYHDLILQDSTTAGVPVFVDDRNNADGLKLKAPPYTSMAGVLLAAQEVTINDHRHGVSIADHVHQQDFGIYEESNAAAINVWASDDAAQTWTQIGGPYTTTQFEIDVTSFFTTTGWKALRFDSDLRCRIVGTLEMKLDINA